MNPLILSDHIITLSPQGVLQIEWTRRAPVMGKGLVREDIIVAKLSKDETSKLRQFLNAAAPES